MTQTCKTCKFHYNPTPMGLLPVHWTGPLCLSPNRTETTPVHGSKTVAISCSTARADSEDCGPDAYGWEPTLRTRLVYFLRSILGARDAS